VPRSPSAPASSRFGAGRWVIAGLLALALVDVALISFAFSSTRAPAAGSASPQAMPSFLPVESSATPTPMPDFSVAPLTATLAAFDENVAYRAVTGGCRAVPGVVEATGDGGATWTPAELPEGSAPQSIVAESASQATVVAALTAGCAPAAFGTFVQGVDWAPSNGLSDYWHIEGAEVVAPGDARWLPCPGTPRQVAAADAQSAAVLCDDAVLAITLDGGANWLETEPVSGAAAIAMQRDDAGSGIRVLVAAQAECDGVQVATVATDGTKGAAGECVATDAADGASALAVDSTGGVWLWSGELVARLADGGATW
jgi:hypothetical protein